jgi:hypothetical protein
MLGAELSARRTLRRLPNPPLYQKSMMYLIKRYNGSWHWWWLTDVVSSGVFAFFYYYGTTHFAAVGSVGGVSPAFCAAKRRL